jgi:hypothetical protein
MIPHRFWIAAILAAPLLAAGGGHLLRYAQEEMAARTQALETEHQRAAATLRQLRHDAAMAERLSRSMEGDDMEKYLAPVSRMKAAAQMERLATTANLSHFVYTLSPERPLHADTGDMAGIAQSLLTLEADAPEDEAVYRFLFRLNRALPGRSALKHLSIERPGPDAPAASNVRMKAEVEWLSNGSGEGRHP